MARSLLSAVIGALLGAVATYLIGLPATYDARTETSASAGHDRGDTLLPPVPMQVQRAVAPDSDASNARGSDARGDTGSGITAARLRAYELAMQASDALDILAMLEGAARAPLSRARDLEIGVLLERLAELDPLRAVEYAQTLLDTEFLVQAYGALARADAELALSRLQSVTPPGKQRRIAIAMLDVLGSDERGVERIAQALPASRRSSFAIDALLARAAADPISALVDALAHDRLTLQAYILPRLAEIAAQRDPLGAFAFSESITAPSSRSTFQSALLNAWANVEPAAALEWLETADESRVASVVSGAFPALANADPERLLAMIDGLPASVRRQAQSAALSAYAEHDPMGAFAMLDTVPVGLGRDRLMRTIAQAYARQAPERALEWAESLTPSSPWALQGILSVMAAADPERALDAFFAELDRPGARVSGAPSSAVQALSLPDLMSTFASSGADIARITDRLLRSNDRNVRSMLSAALSSWASHDVDAALTWTRAHVDEVDAPSMRAIAQRIGTTSFDLAVSTLNRLPPAQREAWFQPLVDLKLADSAEAALTFLDAHRGEPGFDAALGYVAQRMASSDPVRAASILTASGSAEAMQRSRMVAAQWARRDPAAAARWVLEDITDAEARTAALNAVAAAWAARDTAAAERWLFSLESGAHRDAAADGLMLATARAGRFEPRILDAYSSEPSRQRAASRAIVTIGQADAVQARDLMDAHLTDPAIRARTEMNIARTSASRSASPIAPGSLVQ